MALVSTKKLYQMLPPNMAVGAFNVHNMEYTQAVVQAAEEENSPVILMLGEPILDFADLGMLTTIAKYAASSSKLPIAVALDHGKKVSNITRFIDLGLSVMVDGSHYSFQDNIAFTKEMVLYAKRKKVAVEGELGALAGVEDLGSEEADELLTDPEAAEEFVRRTGVDSLAIAIGNCHGKYKGTPKLDIPRLQKIAARVDVPLVLHGGSDLPVEVSLEAINNGIRKFNIGTDLKYAFCEGLRDVLASEPMPFQPQDTLGAARDCVVEVTRDKIRLFRNGK